MHINGSQRVEGKEKLENDCNGDHDSLQGDEDAWGLDKHDDYMPLWMN